MVVSQVPDKPDAEAKYLFYIHGSGMDTGRAGSKRAYEKGIKALSELGFIVITEIRSKDTIKKFPVDHEKYARKIAGGVKELLVAGVPARNITVVGFSRGAVVTLIASGFINNSEVGFVIMAGCIAKTGEYKKILPYFYENAVPNLTGRFLSFWDSGDTNFRSCIDYFNRVPSPISYEEVKLSSGKGHGAFESPNEKWINPLAEWTGIKSNND